jgi:integrase
MNDKAMAVKGQTDLTTLANLGQIANEVAAQNLFADYRSRKAERTVKRQDADLALFAEYLSGIVERARATGTTPELESAPTGHDLAHDAKAWQPITWGLVTGFRQWQLQRGYAVGSVNVRLSTVRTYARLALKAGVLDADEYTRIRAVEGYDSTEAKRIDAARKQAEIDTRRGAKKAEPTPLTKEQADQLKVQPDTSQGRRDALLMHLLLDLGLRVNEVILLRVGAVDLVDEIITFYRPKVDKWQTHRLADGLLRAVKAWIERDALAVGPLLRASRKGGKLTGRGMSERAVFKRVVYLGARVGVDGLSPHDLRHYWATRAARNGTPAERLKDAGGWTSIVTADRYVQAAAIANEGIVIDG